jgi:uncharacterized protein
MLLALSIPTIAYGGGEGRFVYDDADILTTTEEYRLEDKLSSISQQYGAQISIITLDNCVGSIDSYVEDIYDDMGLGYGEDHDGVLLLVCMDVREYRILSNGFAASAISTDDIDEMCDYIVSYLSDGDYYRAFERFADRCEYYLNGYINGFPFDFLKYGLISLGIGAAVGLITVLIMKAQLKSVRKKHDANVYVKSGSMHITRAGDYFLYRNLSKTAKQTNNSSSSGGGSRSVGGGRF